MSAKKKADPAPPLVLKQIVELLAGLQGLPTTVTTLMVASIVYSVQDLITAFTAHKKLLDAANKAKLDLAAAEKARDDALPAMTTLLKDTRAAIKPMVGRKNAALVTFGMSPDKTAAPLTNVQEAERIAKSNATRKARGTMGKRQKEKIHGTVPAAPPPAGAPPAPAPPVLVPPKTGL